MARHASGQALASGRSPVKKFISASERLDAHLAGREARRFKADERAWDRLDRRLDLAERQLGQLCRAGKLVHYVFPVGGRYREGTRHDLIAFLLRNGYA
jgi:hypothetical protein